MWLELEDAAREIFGKKTEEEIKAKARSLYEGIFERTKEYRYKKFRRRWHVDSTSFDEGTSGKARSLIIDSDRPRHRTILEMQRSLNRRY